LEKEQADEFQPRISPQMMISTFSCKKISQSLRSFQNWTKNIAKTNNVQVWTHNGWEICSVCRTETMHRFLCFYFCKFSNYFAVTLGCYLFLLFLVQFLKCTSTVVVSHKKRQSLTVPPFFVLRSVCIVSVLQTEPIESLRR